MRRKRELNESVQATFKDGNTKLYMSPKEAAEDTGLSENSVKARCNKPGSGSKSKDGITFIWADEHTRKSKQAKRSKAKGNNFELEVASKLKNIGYNGVVSSRSQDKRSDANKIDLVDMANEFPINVQCKYMANTPNYFVIRDACTDKDKPFVVIWKKATNDGSNSPGTVAIIDSEYFYHLLEIERQYNLITT